MQFDQLKRREFITLLGGAAAWPVAAMAQQPAMPTIGWLNVRSPEMSAHLIAAFHQGLRATGYVEGQNIRIEYLYANGRRDLLPALATDLVARRVAVIATGPGGERAAKSATATIPIVFMSGGDPVRMDLVASLNRPGGNLTGVTMLGSDLEAKRIGFAATIAVLVSSNTNSPEAEFQFQEIQAAGRCGSVPASEWICTTPARKSGSPALPLR
jgi:putative ABC transport system substrate-binding protein